MFLYIIRHGDPIYDPDSLTPLGERQAEAVGRRLSEIGLDRIYCSPLIRARQTAQPTCEMLRMEPQIEEWTSEELAWRDFACDLPDGGYSWAFHAQNTTFNTKECRALGEKWYEDPAFAKIDGKAAYQRIMDASDEFIARQGYRRDGLIYHVERPNDDRVAVFCHQGFGVTWLSHLLQIPPQMFWASFDITYTSVTIIEFANNKDGITQPKCLCLSDVSHIYAERLPMVYNREKRI